MAKRREVECPHCGGRFREGRKACPHCGSDDQTGWMSIEQQESAELDLNETYLSDEEYEQFIRRDGLGEPTVERRPKQGTPLAKNSPRPALLLLALLLAYALWQALR